jgi:hypothetical protein
LVLVLVLDVEVEVEVEEVEVEVEVEAVALPAVPVFPTNAAGVKTESVLCVYRGTCPAHKKTDSIRVKRPPAWPSVAASCLRS